MCTFLQQGIIRLERKVYDLVAIWLKQFHSCRLRSWSFHCGEINYFVFEVAFECNAPYAPIYNVGAYGALHSLICTCNTVLHWWYEFSKLINNLCCDRNVSERLVGRQTNQRAEIMVETVLK